MTQRFMVLQQGETLYFYDELYTTTEELKAKVKLANPGKGHRWAGGDDGGATVVMENYLLQSITVIEYRYSITFQALQQTSRLGIISRRTNRLSIIR